MIAYENTSVLQLGLIAVTLVFLSISLTTHQKPQWYLMLLYLLTAHSFTAFVLVHYRIPFAGNAIGFLFLLFCGVSLYDIYDDYESPATDRLKTTQRLLFATAFVLMLTLLILYVDFKALIDLAINAI